MRPIDRLRTGRKDSIGRTITVGGTGGNWEMPAFWTNEAVRDAEELDQNFEGYVSGAYKANGVVFTCVLIRMLTFSEVRFSYQTMLAGRPGELYGGPSLGLLENPWPNGTTGELLARAEQDVSLAGNFYATVVDDRDGRRIRRMRPDHVKIVTGSRVEDEKGNDPINPWALDARVVAYIYAPPLLDPIILLPDRVVHWSPIPDPEAQWRGMSWITPIVNEIKADNAVTRHKLKYFQHGTTGGMVIKYDPSVEEETVRRFAAFWQEQHQGVDNAYKTFHIGGGADATVVAADLKQLDFKVTQGAGETRIAAESGVGAIIAQLSEGMQGSSLNSGNFSAARRRFGDMWARPQWRSVCAALQRFTTPNPGDRLWYDVHDVSFLQEDEKDAADILLTQAKTIRALTDGGFQPDEAVRAVTSGNLLSLVGQHSGLYSVQLQEAGAGAPPQESANPVP